MLRKLPLLTLLLALGIVGASCSIQTLDGCWTNELHATVNITLHEDGTLRGNYKSAVSSLRMPVEGDLIGFQFDMEQPTFGFVVKWTSVGVRGDITVWTGEMFLNGGAQTLRTMWLARSPCSVENNWGATLTGMDVFTRSDGTC